MHFLSTPPLLGVEGPTLVLWFHALVGVELEKGQAQLLCTPPHFL